MMIEHCLFLLDQNMFAHSLVPDELDPDLDAPSHADTEDLRCVCFSKHPLGFLCDAGNASNDRFDASLR